MAFKSLNSVQSNLSAKVLWSFFSKTKTTITSTVLQICLCIRYVKYFAEFVRKQEWFVGDFLHMLQ